MCQFVHQKFSRKIIQKEYKENPRYKYYDFVVKMIRVDKERAQSVSLTTIEAIFATSCLLFYGRRK